MLIDFAEALQENLEEYAWNGNVDVNFIFEDAYDGGLYAKELVDKIKRNENFLDYYDEDGNLVINEAIILCVCLIFGKKIQPRHN